MINTATALRILNDHLEPGEAAYTDAEASALVALFSRTARAEVATARSALAAAPAPPSPGRSHPALPCPANATPSRPPVPRRKR